MKKIFFIVSITLATITAFSCSNDETETANNDHSATEAKQIVNLQKLQNDMANLTKEWQTKQPLAITRSEKNSNFTNNMTNSISITGADLAGAFIGANIGGIGALVGGALASGVAYWERERYGNKGFAFSTIVPNNTIIFKDKSTATMIDSIGYYHNKILMNIGEKRLADAEIEDIEELIINSAIEVTGNTTDFNKPELRNNECTIFFIKNISRLNAAKTTDDFCKILSESNQISKEEINIIKTYIDGLATIDNTNGEYTKAVINTIDNSDINPETATSLKNSVLVGNASQKLWVETTTTNPE